MTKPEFERLVRSAIGKIPPRFRRELREGNIVIMVKSRPGRQQLIKMEMNPDEEDLFGLYEGVPLPQRSQYYNMAVPDKITIFQEPLEEAYPNELALREQVRRTVFHEVAHFFGFDDDELAAMGWG